jgi:hypothetical protein
MLKITTVGGTVHFIDPANGQRMRIPGEGRGSHYGDGQWRPMLSYSGYEEEKEVALAVGVRMLCVGPDFTWFLTSPIVCIEEIAA